MDNPAILVDPYKLDQIDRCQLAMSDAQNETSKTPSERVVEWTVPCERIGWPRHSYSMESCVNELEAERRMICVRIC